ncbi:MAG: WYL domain-containing protein, partial [Blastocatellia bacterium]|nr:WYL domain-containing protein [Blastocatellia bacterium]
MAKELIKAVQTRATRLLELIREIQSNPRQTPEQLWRSLSVSRSQFFEDKKALAQIGFIFEYDRKRERYVIKNDISLPVADLTGIEALSLIMAVRQISAAGDHTLAFDAVRAIKKIIANSNKRVRELLEYAMDDDVLKVRFKVDSQIIDELWQAQERSARLEIVYDDFSQQWERKLEIDPYALYFKGRALYLDAYVPEEEKVLMLRVSRVKKILRRVGAFSMRADYNFRERHRHSFRVMIGENPPQLVKIKFSPNAARYIDEAYHHESQEKLWYADGSLRLSLIVSDPREVLWY